MLHRRLWQNSMTKKTNNLNNTKINQSITGGRLLRRHHDFFLYIIFGFLASLINIIVYFIFRSIFNWQLIYANTIAFFIANLASFFMNKHAVFADETNKNANIWQQLGMFFLYRILSLIPDNLVMLIGLSWMHWNQLIVKIIDQLVVGIFNYITTRSVFRKETNKMRRLLSARTKSEEQDQHGHH